MPHPVGVALVTSQASQFPALIVGHSTKVFGHMDSPPIRRSTVSCSERVLEWDLAIPEVLYDASEYVDRNTDAVIHRQPTARPLPGVPPLWYSLAKPLGHEFNTVTQRFAIFSSVRSQKGPAPKIWLPFTSDQKKPGL